MMAVGSAVAALVLVVLASGQEDVDLRHVGAIFLLGMPTVPVFFQWLIHTLGVRGWTRRRPPRLARSVASTWSWAG